MMKYADEKIIAMIFGGVKEEQEKDRKEEDSPSPLLEGMTLHVQEERHQFARRIIPGGEASIVLSQAFTVMDEGTARLKYPAERRPKLIFTNEQTSINVAFQQTGFEIEADDVEEFSGTMLAVLKRSQPAARWFQEGMREVGGKQVAFFAYLTPALDCNLYNLMLIAELNGRAIACTFNCMEEEMDDWKMLGEAMLTSIKWHLPEKEGDR
ncbi:hypothetical protein ABEW34_12410 [Paenibacillus algorifonticola]|uniref:hypothetical protein n=1 Tax=Paenibacillus algorifonticola TaxID=684063 RepID=UPI003D2DA3B7